MLWDVTTGAQISQFEGHTTDVVWSVDFSPDGTLLASGAGDGTVKLWDVAESKQPVPSKLVIISGDDQQGTFGTALSNPLVVEIRDQYDNPFPGAQVTFTVTAGEGLLSGQFAVEHVTTDANGRAESTLILGSAKTNTVDVSIRRERVTFNALGTSPYHIATLEGHTRDVSSVSFSPGGALLATGSSDGTVKLWDVATRENIVTLQGHEGAVRSVSFSPDGMLLAFGSSGAKLKLWDVALKENYRHA